MYLSETALKELGSIPENFPEANTFNETLSAATIDQKMAPCGCRIREKAPEFPKEIPFEPKEENRSKLEEWIREQYSSSAS